MRFSTSRAGAGTPLEEHIRGLSVSSLIVAAATSQLHSGDLLDASCRDFRLGPGHRRVSQLEPRDHAPMVNVGAALLGVEELSAVSPRCRRQSSADSATAG